MFAWMAYFHSGAVTHLLTQVQAPVRHGKVEHFLEEGVDMSGRSKQLTIMLVVAVVIAALALGLGCGSSASEETATTVSLVPATGKVIGSNSRDRLIDSKLNTTSESPQAYTDAVEQGRPIVLLFYVPGQVDDGKVLASVQTLQASFADYVFLIYNYKDPSAYGDLSTLLDVDYPPEIILVRADGTVKKILSGYQDQGSINQELVNLRTG
jgi:hypothetical protein